METKRKPSRLRQIRNQRGLKADQVAKILGIKTSLYWVYEREPSRMKGEKLLALADFYGVTMDYFFGRDKKEASVTGKEIDYIKMIRGFSRENKKLIHQLILMINNNEMLTKQQEKEN